ncbi:hypothetical protein OGM63_06850 [Plectonema radiosum NIES-515]|uniref:ABC transporter permease n=1 Tax=Plectonema radiosum NIES-515 TaxID=2986073 RepID=A0ABT3AVT8_9CYAN|nr:hypothetical protein [Plectonema radiosum]MCV3213244.1 hypothetical protein [Plectonema radiosum NIES-515]
MLTKVIIWVLAVTKAKYWLLVLSCWAIAIAASITGYATSAYGLSVTNTLTIPGETTDLYSFEGNGANANRLGFFLDLYTAIATRTFMTIAVLVGV